MWISISFEAKETGEEIYIINIEVSYLWNKAKTPKDMAIKDCEYFLFCISKLINLRIIIHIQS